MKLLGASPLGHALAILVGAPPAFFLVFNAVFTDGPPHERLVAVLLIGAAYLLLGGLFGYARPATGGWWSLPLALPAFLLIAWYTTHEPQAWPLHLAVVLTAAVGAYIGGDVAARLRERPHARPKAP